MKIAQFILRIGSVVSLTLLPMTSHGYQGGPFHYQVFGAGLMVNERILKDGVYVGGGLGLDSYRIHQTVELIDASGTLVDESRASFSKGAVSKLFLGYGQAFCWFYFAGEVFAKYTTAQNSFGISNYRSNVSVRTSVGASLIPGIKITPCTLIYTRLGYDRTRFKIFESGTLFGDDSRRQWSNGVDIGLGIEEAITSHFSFRTEYIFSNYDDFRTEFNTKFLPRDNSVSLDFVYHFYVCSGY